MSALTTSSFLRVHLLLSFLSFMHAVWCRLKNIISIQTGRESAGTPPACKFIWFAHQRRSINLLRRETGVVMAHPRADKSIACLLTRFLSGCSCWHDLARWCFTKVMWRPGLKLSLSVSSWTPCNPDFMQQYDCLHVWLRLDEIFKRRQKKILQPLSLFFQGSCGSARSLHLPQIVFTPAYPQDSKIHHLTSTHAWKTPSINHTLNLLILWLRLPS